MRKPILKAMTDLQGLREHDLPGAADGARSGSRLDSVARPVIPGTDSILRYPEAYAARAGQAPADRTSYPARVATTAQVAVDRSVQSATGATREHSLACNMHPAVLVARENDRAEFAAAGRAERKRRNRAARRKAKRATATASPLVQLQAQLRRLES